LSASQDAKITNKLISDESLFSFSGVIRLHPIATLVLLGGVKSEVLLMTLYKIDLQMAADGLCLIAG
jgi:hypothetical protein